MASLFTFDDQQRVSSPWVTPSDSPKPSTPRSGNNNFGAPSLLEDYGITRLEAEPQEGPVEYKLHLLLRPRQDGFSSATYSSLIDSKRQDQDFVNNVTAEVKKKATPVAPVIPSSEKRQSRLEHLSTQLLWRLQQSAPEHGSSSNELVLPKLPEAKPSLEIPTRPAKLLAGLEESRGALYEIGVSDDGTLVGLTKDEMDESIGNLRAMAASLGCDVEVRRMVAVRDCEWHVSPDFSDDIFANTLSQNGGVTQRLRHESKLWVAEALVHPGSLSQISLLSREEKVMEACTSSTALTEPTEMRKWSKTEAFAPASGSEQLRITLTGPTTSGKSSLLGTLSTSTLDNGRGKSRLSLLKHQHEIKSGLTSSVTQELIGYSKTGEVVNYAHGHVSSWADIHSKSESGRLVLVSDSAGHPRYRRTTVRGLIGWAPHWTILCIAADDGQNAPSDLGGTSSAKEILGTASAGIDLAKAHLELCLKLERPLAIVITKLDLVSTTTLRNTLSKILSAIKATGRLPVVLPPDRNKFVSESELGHIPPLEADAVQKLIDKIKDTNNLILNIPIVVTSSSKGRGIRTLHSLLQKLPLPPAPTSHDFTGLALNPEQPACVFHIEDVFTNQPISYDSLAAGNGSSSGSVVSGYLRFGRLSINDIITIGPFPAGSEDNELPPENMGNRNSPNSVGSTLYHWSVTDLTRVASRKQVLLGDWHTAKVVSIRNLRLPVHALEAGQVGTIGIVLNDSTEVLIAPRIRKGMVIAIPRPHMIETRLQAAAGFSACFEDGDVNSITPGSIVVIYTASVRATARILHLAPHAESEDQIPSQNEEVDDFFGLDDSDEREPDFEPPIFGSDGITTVTFELLTNRAWIELGSQVLVMPGGGMGLYSGSERGEKGIAGLEGFVGRVMEVVD